LGRGLERPSPPLPNGGGGEGGGFGDAEEGEGAGEVFGELVDEVVDAGFAGGGEGVEVGAAEHHGIGTEGHGHGDVAAPAHTAVADDVDVAAHRVGYLGHQLQDGRCAAPVSSAPS